jgi:hypothetical protein
MFSEKVNVLKIEIASHFGQIWPALSMWVKGVLISGHFEVSNVPQIAKKCQEHKKGCGKH